MAKITSKIHSNLKIWYLNHIHTYIHTYIGKHPELYKFMKTFFDRCALKLNRKIYFWENEQCYSFVEILSASFHFNPHQKFGFTRCCNFHCYSNFYLSELSIYEVFFAVFKKGEGMQRCSSKETKRSREYYSFNINKFAIWNFRDFFGRNFPPTFICRVDYFLHLLIHYVSSNTA